MIFVLVDYEFEDVARWLEIQYTNELPLREIRNKHQIRSFHLNVPEHVAEDHKTKPSDVFSDKMKLISVYLIKNFSTYH